MLNVRLGSLQLSSPVIMMSGVFGYGEVKIEGVNYKKIGAIITKTITLLPREGNPQPRIWESGNGMLNSIGLQNPGVRVFISEELPEIKKRKIKSIISISGQNSKELLQVLNPLLEEGVKNFEVNLSCPNVFKDKLMVSQSAEETYKLLKDAKKVSKDAFLIAKLSPNVTNIVEIAKAAEDAGADALSLINTVKGACVDIPGKRIIEGGLSGPPIKSIGLKSVYDIYKRVTIPIIGIGGITTGEDALEYMLIGSDAVGVGSGFFSNPILPEEIYDTLKEFIVKNNYKNIRDIVGLFNEKREENTQRRKSKI